jgi:hypothetical protein
MIVRYRNNNLVGDNIFVIPHSYIFHGVRQQLLRTEWLNNSMKILHVWPSSSIKKDIGPISNVKYMTSPVILHLYQL